VLGGPPRRADIAQKIGFEQFAKPAPRLEFRRTLLQFRPKWRLMTRVLGEPLLGVAHAVVLQTSAPAYEERVAAAAPRAAPPNICIYPSCGTPRPTPQPTAKPGSRQNGLSDIRSFTSGTGAALVLTQGQGGYLSWQCVTNYGGYARARSRKRGNQ